MAYPKVVLNEECMREGMQIESVDITVEQKLGLLDALSATGLRSIVVGSFVSPKYTPQMASVDELVSRMKPADGVHYLAVALNDRGRQRAAEHMPPLEPWPAPPSLMCHLCDTFIRRNSNTTQAAEIARWPAIVRSAVADSVSEGGIGLGAAWGSNFSGRRTSADRMTMLRREASLWNEAGIPVTWLSLWDPMSWCMPDQVEETLDAAISEFPSITTVWMHLHDARGMALPSVYATLRVLDERHTLFLDTTAGGIGGCPYCGNGRATGMAATEDAVNMLEAMGIATGVDLDALIAVVWMLEEILGRPTPGHVSKAGPLPVAPAAFYDPNLPFVETHDEARHFRLGDKAPQNPIRPWKTPIPQPGLLADA
jgi:hydroxymethylglutaryl-CoA lyase